MSPFSLPRSGSAEAAACLHRGPRRSARSDAGEGMSFPTEWGHRFSRQAVPRLQDQAAGAVLAIRVVFVSLEDPERLVRKVGPNKG
jgi:hypothetical protein